jgi:thiamine-phosphate pyrophosphorylase
MPPQLTLPIIYLITNGKTTAKTTPNSHEFSNLLRLVEYAVAAKVSVIQIREKSLTARVLYELTSRAVAITRNSATRLLVNDRFDVALGAGADGVHLTSRSMAADVVRSICGPEFLIGVSTHSLSEARIACAECADFVVFGPVFETESKRTYGEPQGLLRLQEVCSSLSGFPVIGIGGIQIDNVADCLRAGAEGVAAISMLSDTERLPLLVETIRTIWLTKEN